ncbi:MAG: hypothetical protein HY319_04950 [Armatimonadetes bacterium]|nr:hypothetical protein [Armatimonadota bacterium]
MRRGLSLLEVVVALGLLALVLPMLVNLIPSSAVALRRAQDIDAATAYAHKVLEEARRDSTLAPGATLEAEVTINRTNFRMIREVYEVSPASLGLVDVVVLMQGTPSFPPIRLSTRMGAGGS